MLKIEFLLYLKGENHTFSNEIRATKRGNGPRGRAAEHDEQRRGRAGPTAENGNVSRGSAGSPVTYDDVPLVAIHLKRSIDILSHLLVVLL